MELSLDGDPRSNGSLYPYEGSTSDDMLLDDDPQLYRSPE